VSLVGRTTKLGTLVSASALDNNGRRCIYYCHNEGHGAGRIAFNSSTNGKLTQN
jgi:hypothetical protein